MARTSNYKTLNALMRHIRDDAGISIAGSQEKRALACVGYFHGYKGYRYAGVSSNRIPYRSFAEMLAVISFDSAVKALLYPFVMRIEMTMKNLALVEMLDEAESSSLIDVYTRLMPATDGDARVRKLEVINQNGQVLLDSYKGNNAIARHYYDGPAESVPLWALLELLTLGHFARLLTAISSGTLMRIAHAWGIQKRDADLVPHLVFAITELRNAVAHNGVIFDTRFATGRIRKKVPAILIREIGLPDTIGVQFKTVTDYMLLVVFLGRRLGFSKLEVESLVGDYEALTHELRKKVPVSVFDMIVHTDNRAKMVHLAEWVDTTALWTRRH